MEIINDEGNDGDNAWDLKTFEEGMKTKAVLAAFFSRYKSKLAAKK